MFGPVAEFRGNSQRFYLILTILLFFYDFTFFFF